MIITQKIESLLFENNKLNNEKINLIEKVNILTELLNHPEDIGKYVDENGNLNIAPEYDNDEEINFDNKNIIIEKDGDNKDQSIKDEVKNNKEIEKNKEKENSEQIIKDEDNKNNEENNS